MPHICILSPSTEFRTEKQEAAVQLAVLSRYVTRENGISIATGGLVNPSNEVTKEDKHVILDHG
jgi:hypothetical protein